ncbi:MAG TPA: VWA domain-containing protein, partial [Candidatus Acidoferrales bacterium]|nr:VWA domain-containing protein [Candidatus Acidoferrales bacterium]
MNLLRKSSFRQSTVSAVNRLSGTIVAILAAGAWACTALAMGRGAAQSRVPVMHVEVDLQPIEVQVADANGNNIPGLNGKDFTVLENGQRQRIAFFDAGKSPVSVAILVDSSNSMNSNGPLGSAQAIAVEFMSTARPGDDIYAMDFTDQTGPFQQLTREQLLNPSAVTLATAPSGGSALYDAIAAALCHLRASKNLRRAVIVISDGVDQYSHISLEQLIALVRSSHAQLFMIGLQSRPEFGFQGRPEPKLTLITGHDIDNPVVVFDDLMKESGAESFIPKSGSSLKEALLAVSNMLQSEYTLAYYPGKSSSQLRKIEVKVDRPGAHVLARRFVDSQRDASQFVHFDQATCTVSSQSYPYPYETHLTRGPGGMTYHEDFSDSHSGWPIHEDSHYVSGGYELSNVPVPAGNVNDAMRASAMGGSVPYSVGTAEKSMAFRENIIAAYGPWWTDFHASVTVKVVPPPQSHGARSQFPYAARPAAGLVFRMNSKGYYALLIGGIVKKKKLSVELVRRDFLPDTQQDYAETRIVPWTTVAEAAPPGTELSADDIGDQITIFVDGQEVGTVRDSTYDQG